MSEAVRRYWHSYLDGFPGATGVGRWSGRPTHRPGRPTRPASVRFDPAAFDRLLPGPADRLARFAALLSCLHLCLHHHTGHRRVSVGVPPLRAAGAAGATGQLAVLPIIGLVHRRQRFRGLLGQVHRDLIAAYQHSGYPLEQLTADLGAAADAGGGLPLDVVCRHAGLHHELPDLPASLEITFQDRVSAGRVEQPSAALRFDPELFSAQEAEWFSEHLAHLLHSASLAPDRPLAELVTLPPKLLHTVTVEWNENRTPAPADHCVHRLVEAWAAERGDAPAIRSGDVTVTYRELNDRANQLARWLRGSGVGPGDVVGVAIPRSVTQAATILAVLKAGAAYTPLDPAQPPERLRFIAADSGARTIVTTETGREGHRELFAQAGDRSSQEVAVVPVTDAEREARRLPAGDLPVADLPASVACVIYTSGTTGTPKGVLLTHNGISNCLRWEQVAYQLEAGDRLLHLASPMFSLAILELFSPLCAGAQVVLAPPDISRDTASIARLVADHGVTILSVVPSELALLLDEPTMSWTALRCVVTGADVVSVPLQARFLTTCPSVPLINVYGQTEAAIDGAYWICRPRPGQTRVPVGRPTANTQIYILDEEMRPAPVGVPGELYTGGMAVAVGYRNQPALTATRFVPDPLAADGAGARLYRTGDIARWLPDGVIEVLGRKDHQVKIHGVRLELEEVEALLRSHPGVYDAVVSVRTAPPSLPPVPTTPDGWESLLATVDAGTVERLLAEIE